MRSAHPMVVFVFDRYFGVAKHPNTGNTRSHPPMPRPHLPGQLLLTRSPIDHPHAEELEKIGEILSANPRIALVVAQDLVRGVKNPQTGATGLSGDQVLRLVLV